jgi:hypothetical protein
MSLLPHATFVVVGGGGVLSTLAVVMWLASISEIKDFSAMQHGMAVAYALMIGLWLGAEAGFFVARYQVPYKAVDTSPEEAEEEDGELMQPRSPKDADANAKVGPVHKSQLGTLRAWGEFIFYMGYIYLCDRTPLFSKVKPCPQPQPSPDPTQSLTPTPTPTPTLTPHAPLSSKGPKLTGSSRFWAVNVLILLCALCTLRSSGPGEMKPLQRDQTEEWKGWMQLMFILYHYFAEAPYSAEPHPSPYPHPEQPPTCRGDPPPSLYPTLTADQAPHLQPLALLTRRPSTTRSGCTLQPMCG